MESPEKVNNDQESMLNVNRREDVQLPSQRRKERSGDLADWKWLGEFGPGFGLNGTQLKVVKSPDEYYAILLEKASSAKRRISLASLYLGTGELEQNLIGALKSNLVRNPKLKVKVLLDYARGSRDEINSRTMFAPLTQSPGRSCEVFLYHTPALRGAVKKWLPPRWNEIVGVQHMKIYIFDDSLLISGANMSHDYFTNRQDRYLVIEGCEKLANFYDGLIDQVSKFSFKLDEQNQAHLHPSWSVHPSEGDSAVFASEAKKIVSSYYEHNRRNNEMELRDSSEDKLNSLPRDTWVFPLIQMGPLNIGNDDLATSRIFQRALPGSIIKLATGYFNLTTDYTEKIINKSMCNYEILMAHPKANGFFGAKGFAGGIPAAYTLLAKKFLDAIKISKQENRISMWEYWRPSWTFHSKGLWYYPPGENLPTVTLIGSPNFGHRSVYLDLETQLYVVTRNNSLRIQLDQEQKNLFKHSHPFGDTVLRRKDRRVPNWVKFTIRLFRKYF